MENRLLKTSNDVFLFLSEQKYHFLHKAQEAEDLGNAEGASALNAIAAVINSEIKNILAGDSET